MTRLTEKPALSLPGAMPLSRRHMSKQPEKFDLRSQDNRKPSRVICPDAGVQGNDRLKTNAAQTMKARGALKFQTV